MKSRIAAGKRFGDGGWGMGDGKGEFLGGTEGPG